MTELIEKLKLMATQAHKSDALTIKQAIYRIHELEAKLSDYEEDITDWQVSVESQMSRRKEIK